MSQTITEAPELKPCPFCGGSASIERYGDRRQSTIYQCDNCSCQLETGEEWGHGRDWNRRAIPAVPPAVPGEVGTDLVDRLIELADSIEALKLPEDAQTNGWRGFLMARKQAAELARNAAKDFDRAALSVPLPEVEGGDKGDGWQTMETAPKDGTNILAAFWLWNDPEKGRAMEVVSWDGEAWSSDAYPIYPPTHWMPLPAAPSASIEGETP